MAGFSDEAVQAALNGRFVVRTYPFPGIPDLKIAVRLLRDEEIDGVRLQAVEDCKGKRAELVADPEFLDRLVHRETVARAFFDSENTTQYFFGSGEDVAKLDALTVRSLFELYNLHAQAMDPYAYVSADEAKGLAETLGKSEWPAETLSLFDMHTLRSSLLSMAHLVREMSATRN